MKLLPCLLAALQLSAAAAFSQTEGDPYKNGTNPAKPTPAADSARLQVLSFEEEVISLPLMDAFQLMRSHSDDAARYAESVKLVEAGKAKVERLVTVRCKPGRRMVAESIVEFRYPVEYSNREGDADEGKSRITPRTFETRNIGDTVELQVELGPDPQMVEVEIIPSKTQFLSDRKFVENIEQPIFHSQKLQTSVSLKIGRPFLLGTLNPPYNDGYANTKEQRVWLDFITFREVKEGINEPVSEVKSADVSSNFVTVGGEVKAPQRVPYAPKLTLLEAIQSAGGFTEYASRKKVVWISEGKKAVVDATIIMNDPSQDVILKPRDQIQVQSSTF